MLAFETTYFRKKIILPSLSKVCPSMLSKISYSYVFGLQHNK